MYNNINGRRDEDNKEKTKISAWPRNKIRCLSTVPMPSPHRSETLSLHVHNEDTRIYYIYLYYYYYIHKDSCSLGRIETQLKQ